MCGRRSTAGAFLKFHQAAANSVHVVRLSSGRTRLLARPGRAALAVRFWYWYLGTGRWIAG